MTKSSTFAYSIYMRQNDRYMKVALKISLSYSFQTWYPNNCHYYWTSNYYYSLVHYDSYSYWMQTYSNLSIWNKYPRNDNSQNIPTCSCSWMLLPHYSNIPVGGGGGIPIPWMWCIGLAIPTPSITRWHWRTTTTSTYIAELLHWRPNITGGWSSPIINRPIIPATFCTTKVNLGVIFEN